MAECLHICEKMRTFVHRKMRGGLSSKTKTSQNYDKKNIMPNKL